MTLYDVWYNYGSISPAIVWSVSFTFLGFYYFLCWNDKVFTLFSRLVVSPCKTAHSFAWWNVQAACLILHHQPCQRDRSVGPRGRTLSPWQTAQQPLRQKQQREPNQPAKPRDRRRTQSFVRTRGGNEKTPDISDTRKSNEAKLKTKNYFLFCSWLRPKSQSRAVMRAILWSEEFGGPKRLD